jgi:PEGA domain-containing protein
MKRLLTTPTGLASMTFVLVCLLVLPASVLAGQADRASAGGGSAGGGGGVASAGGSGGAMSASGGGGGADRAGAGGFAGGGSSSDSGGNRGGATGSSGIAMPRGGDHGGGMSAPRYTSGSSGTVSPRSGRTQDNPGEREPSGVPRYSRPHDPSTPTVGTAVPRPPDSTPNVKGGGTTYVIPGGYYGGYYGGMFGYGYGGGYYGGYYDPWYDPWYGGYPGYGYPQQTSSYSDEGALRLKIKPRDAEVYVDGYFVGIVDEFDGAFQRLHVDPGVHRIEVRAAGYEALVFEVRIVPERKTTYQGEMHKLP